MLRTVLYYRQAGIACQWFFERWFGVALTMYSVCQRVIIYYNFQDSQIFFSAGCVCLFLFRGPPPCPVQGKNVLPVCQGFTEIILSAGTFIIDSA